MKDLGIRENYVMKDGLIELDLHMDYRVTVETDRTTARWAPPAPIAAKMTRHTLK